MILVLGITTLLSVKSARATQAGCAAAIAAHEATVVTAAIGCGTPEPGWGIVCPLEAALLAYSYYEMIQACQTPPPPPVPPTTQNLIDNPGLYADDDGIDDIGNGGDLAGTISYELAGYSGSLGGWVSANQAAWDPSLPPPAEY
jgi:hypothetical protein